MTTSRAQRDDAAPLLVDILSAGGAFLLQLPLERAVGYVRRHPGTCIGGSTAVDALRHLRAVLTCAEGFSKEPDAHFPRCRACRKRGRHVRQAGQLLDRVLGDLGIEPMPASYAESSAGGRSEARRS